MSALSSTSLSDFVNDMKFPCIMAKAVFSKGIIHEHLIQSGDPQEAAVEIVNEVENFLKTFRKSKDLSSFSVSFKNPSFSKFEQFEGFFWKLLEAIDGLDKQKNPADPRVSSDPESPRFSFSMGGEAFFMLVLHPESPRMARRFSVPTIVFNPHQQFEDLRAKGVYQKVRDMIRKRDIQLQGFINPMVMDHGKKSEVFQYIGREYAPESKCPFHKGIRILKSFIRVGSKAA